METCIENAKRVDTDDELYPIVSRLYNCRLLNKLFKVITRTLEYALGIHMGAAIGFLCGKLAGIIYTRHFGPMNIIEINNSQQLWVTQYAFAIGGLLIGSIAGIILIVELTHKLHISRKEQK